MTGERTIEVFDDPHLEPSGATTSGLATRFVGPGNRSAETAPPETGPADQGLPEAGLTETGPPETAPPVAAQPVTAPARTADAAPTGAGTTLLRAGLVASTIGLCVLMFVGYVYYFSDLQQHRDQRALLNAFTTPDKAQILSTRPPPEGSPAGVLTIPAIGLSQVVVEGTSATDLLKGPGLMPGTARPGSLGNAVIAGHRTIAGAPFLHLARLRRGDRIQVVTARGAYRYRVVAVGSARPGAEDPISPNRHPRLSLVTSGGSAASDGRSYVIAALVGTANRLPVPHRPPTPAQRGLSGDSAAVLPSIFWALVLAGGLAATFWAYWRFRGRHWSVYLLSTPILLAMAFVWYENLIRLLPGTM